MIPPDPGFRSGSVDWSEDAGLTIPAADLDIMNKADWYGEPGEAAWAAANRHFEVLFFILHNPSALRQIVRNFRGAVVWRAYGQPRRHHLPGRRTVHAYREQGRAAAEAAWRRISGSGLPIGRSSRPKKRLPARSRESSCRSACKTRSRGPGWTGETAKILFCLPGYSGQRQLLPKSNLRRTFKTDFAGFPYAFSTAHQSIAVNDPAVLGFLPAGEFERNMQRYRVMFYHSTEPNHVHYHPFEAVRAGMPTVYMAGSLLDSLIDAPPDRALRETIAEARRKIRRILDGDRRLIDAIRSDQHRMLEPMKPENCVDAWEAGMSQVLDGLARARANARPAARRPRIAVILPIAYGGGTFNSAKQLAQALHLGSRQAGEAADIVFGHLDDPRGLFRHPVRRLAAGR